METLKKKVLEEQKPATNFISILTECFRSYSSDPGMPAYSFMEFGDSWINRNELLRNYDLAYQMFAEMLNRVVAAAGDVVVTYIVTLNSRFQSEENPNPSSAFLAALR
ncbi:hypothetical protein J5N97_025030 [Dioscorea zingiberensis]|uniref:Uncharacterized protein n=1 Tax=Dioscorea zingiberensis TaxID=325984 RepID=A0A9D5C8B9_9LILI|nr:hypothetical protein J5N97_025030 [Dioscorea zingiberensis]